MVKAELTEPECGPSAGAERPHRESVQQCAGLFLILQLSSQLLKNTPLPILKEQYLFIN
jgi:hypothetical protein